MYDSDFVEPSPMLENTFKTLLERVSIDILFSDTDGAFNRQIDGVAMESLVAPQLAHFFCQYDDELGPNSKKYFRYVDDFIKSQRTGEKKPTGFCQEFSPQHHLYFRRTKC